MKRIVREDWDFVRGEWKFLLGMPIVVLAMVAITRTGAGGVYLFSFLGMMFWALRERRRDQRRSKERSDVDRNTGSR